MPPLPKLSRDELIDILALSENATAIYTGEEVTIQWANDAMIAFWGKDRSVIGKPLGEAVPVLQGQPFIDMLASVWRTGKTIQGTDTEAQLLIDDKLQTFYYDFAYRGILNPDGSTKCVLHTATDVTERFLSRQREMLLSSELQAANNDIAATNLELTAANTELGESQQSLMQLNSNLAASEAELQFAIDAAALGTFDLNPVTGCFKGNDRLKIWFGLNPEDEIELTRATDVIIEKDRDRVITSINWAMRYESGGVYDEEYTILNSLTQTPRTVRAKGKALFNVDNEVVRLSGTVQDITNERRAHQELLEINERLQMALGAGELGSFDLDLLTSTIIGTDQFKKNYGWPVKQAFSRNELLEAIHPDYRDRAISAVKQAIANDNVYRAEYPVTYPDGSHHWLSVSGVIRRDDEGRAIKMVGVTYDITERRELEQRKDDFISIASHELKTPVTSLKASLQLLDRMKENPNAQMLPRLIEQSNRSMEKITDLIDDLLNVSKMNEGRLGLSKDVMYIADVLNNCCEHIRAAGKYKLTLAGDESLKVLADENQIDQVVVNLVNNAVKYAPNSREIKFTLEQAGDFAKVSVHDEGPGIAPEKQEHLFDRYYQATASGFQNSGLGLGLYISAEIIKRHGGEMGVESELGKGSTFWFTLPLAAMVITK